MRALGPTLAVDPASRRVAPAGAGWSRRAPLRRNRCTGARGTGEAVVAAWLPGLYLTRIGFAAHDALPLHRLLRRQADAALPGRVVADIGEADRIGRVPAAELRQIADRIDAVAPLGHTVIATEIDADQAAVAAIIAAVIAAAAGGPDPNLAVVLTQCLVEAGAADLARVVQVRTQGDHQRLRRALYRSDQPRVTAVEFDGRVRPDARRAADLDQLTDQRTLPPVVHVRPVHHRRARAGEDIGIGLADQIVAQRPVMLATVLPRRIAGVVVVDEGHRHFAPARVGIAVEAVLPVGDRAILHPLLEGEVEDRALGPVGPILDHLLPAGRVAPVPARIFAGRLPQLPHAERVVMGRAHPAVDPLAGVATDEVEAKAASAVVAAQVSELVVEHAIHLGVGGVEVRIAAHEAITVIAVVGIVARVAAVVPPEALASRQIDFLVGIAAVHVVGHHVVKHLHLRGVQRGSRLFELAIAAIATVLVEVVPEVAFAAAGVGTVAPAGEVAPGHRHPDGAEAVGGDGRRHLAEPVVPGIGRLAHGVPVKTLQNDFIAAVVTHTGRALARQVGGMGRTQGQQQGRRRQGEAGRR